jgi:glutaconyl-CoA/methylmalonyl-CoA decarboxylase subunit gamma
MPGNILGVNVNVGDTVKNGQALVVLEAMKMENDITSPCDGKVVQVAVNKGDTVETGALLVVIG